MRDNLMSPTRKIQNTLIALLVAVLVTFLAWVVLRERTKTSQLPGTPTVAPYTGFAVNIPQKALLRNYVTVSVEAVSGTNCELTFVPPSGEIQVMDTIADIGGQCVWRWKLEESVGKGAGRLIFTINGVSDTHFMEIRSSF
jgi:hypothetical protein